MKYISTDPSLVLLCVGTPGDSDDHDVRVMVLLLSIFYPFNLPERSHIFQKNNTLPDGLAQMSKQNVSNNTFMQLTVWCTFQV